MYTGEPTCALCNVLRFMWVLVEVQGLAKKVTAEKYFARGKHIIINLSQWDCNAVRSLQTRRYAPHPYPRFIIMFACSMYSLLCIWIVCMLVIRVKICKDRYWWVFLLYPTIFIFASTDRFILTLLFVLIQLITQLPQLPPFISTDVLILTDLAVLAPRVSFWPWFCHK